MLPEGLNVSYIEKYSKNNLEYQEKRIGKWFNTFFNLSYQIQSIKNKNKFSILVVVPNLRYIASILASGYCCSYINENTKNKLTDNDIHNNQNKINIEDYLSSKENINKFYSYKKTDQHQKIALKYLGYEELNMFESSKRFLFNKYQEFNDKFLLKIYKFENIHNKRNLIFYGDEIINSIDLISNQIDLDSISAGSRLENKRSGLEEFFFNTDQIKFLNNISDKCLCRIYGNSEELYKDMCKSTFYFDDSKNVIEGRLNDLIRANKRWLGKLQRSFSEVISSRSKNNPSELKDCELVIYSGSESYVKYSSMNYDKNELILLSPEETLFEVAISKANNDSELNSEFLINENLKKFGDKYPMMAYLK